MIATNENFLAKIGKMMKLSFGTAILLCSMIVFSSNEASAQSLVQGEEAMMKLKPRVRQLNTSNCLAQAPNGTPANVATRATELRCEFYADVYNLLPATGRSNAPANPNGTGNAINTAYNNLKVKYSDSVSVQAADLLKNEITDFLKS